MELVKLRLYKIIYSPLKYINKGNDRSVNALKNILASLLIRGCSISISLGLVPLTIHYVNPTGYGVWITLSSIIGWFSFFDIGFGHGLRNKFAEALATGQNELARIYVSTTYAILIIISIIILTLFIAINPFFRLVKNFKYSQRDEWRIRFISINCFCFFLSAICSSVDYYYNQC
jgi:O-antigen/teichoic acid export membrane protein